MGPTHRKLRRALFGDYWLIDPKDWTSDEAAEFELWRDQQWAEEHGMKLMIVAFELHGRTKHHFVTFPADQDEPSHGQVVRLFESQPEVADAETEGYEALVASDEGELS